MNEQILQLDGPNRVIKTEEDVPDASYKRKRFEVQSRTYSQGVGGKKGKWNEWRPRAVFYSVYDLITYLHDTCFNMRVVQVEGSIDTGI